MAIFKPSAVVGAISGTIGGVNFVSGKGSPVLRSKRARNPLRSPDALERQATFTRQAHNWSIEPETIRAQWRQAALDFPHTNRFGVTTRLSGFQLYMAYVQWSSTPLDFFAHPMPIMSREPGFQIISLSFTEGGPFNITVAPIAPSTYSRWTVLGSRPRKQAGISFFRDFTRVTALPTPFFTFDIFPAFEFNLGSPAATEAIGIRVFGERNAPGLERIPSTTTEASTIVLA